MSVIIHDDIIQGSEAWEKLRSAKLTGSRMDKAISGAQVKRVKLTRPLVEEDLESTKKRAPKQYEVLSHLISNNGNVPLGEVDSAAVAGLAKKGICETITIENATRLSSGAVKLIDRLLAETKHTSIELGDKLPSYAMERGNDLEDIARIEFENETGIQVREAGFVQNDELGSFIGYSPDGLIMIREKIAAILEIKCPLPQTHLGYLRNGALPSDYKLQVHSGMAICEADHAWFVSYCPPWPTFILLVERDEFTNGLTSTLQEFNDLFKSQLTKYQADHDPMQMQVRKAQEIINEQKAK